MKPFKNNKMADAVDELQTGLHNHGVRLDALEAWLWPTTFDWHSAHVTLEKPPGREGSNGYASLNDRIEQQDKKVAELTDRNDRQAQTIADMRAMNTTRVKMIEGLRAKVAALGDWSEQQDKTIADLHTKLASRDKKVGELLVKNDALQGLATDAMNNSLHRNFDDLRAENATQAKTIDDLQTKNAVQAALWAAADLACREQGIQVAVWLTDEVQCHLGGPRP